MFFKLINKSLGKTRIYKTHNFCLALQAGVDCKLRVRSEGHKHEARGTRRPANILSPNRGRAVEGWE